MSASALQSINYPIELRPQGGSTWYTLVCLETYDSDLSRATNDAATFCAIFIGISAPKWQLSGSAVCNATPSATEVTLTDMDNWLLQLTSLECRVQMPVGGGSTGDDYYLHGVVLVSDVKMTAATGQVIKFNFTLSGQGVPTNVPGA